MLPVGAKWASRPAARSRWARTLLTPHLPQPRAGVGGHRLGLTVSLRWTGAHWVFAVEPSPDFPAQAVAVGVFFRAVSGTLLIVLIPRRRFGWRFGYGCGAWSHSWSPAIRLRHSKQQPATCTKQPATPKDRPYMSAKKPTGETALPAHDRLSSTPPQTTFS